MEGRDPGRVVLVFGASSGIGSAVAERLARRGDRLVLVARSDEAVVAAARRCRAAGGGEVEAVTADVAIGREVDGVVEGVVERHGRLDAVVLAAGVMAYGRVEDVPAEVFDRVVATLVTGTANVARAVLPRFRQQGGGTLVVIQLAARVGHRAADGCVRHGQVGPAGAHPHPSARGP
jgi:NAD(P)-dependent dehydrogenase (short-subunit alcohol dehydrogenase family)